MSYMLKQIDHVQLAAPEGCEDEARKFYAGIFGFEEMEKPPVLKKRGGAWFKFGSVQLHIGVEELFVPAKKAHPAFEVDNLEALKDHLENNGIQVTEDDHLPGASRFYVNDPFGNRLEFLEWK
ncbi:glyoxalase [Neobacillus notoginsengisoli]|uniref:Glyoxalase n=1 Tax=Neobacillus notoginsengisoli TaxID=1578198 RepID=A0A417YRY5_9BACI|nr:VOC family protein [Neobacillus notoginsengisoli]RHW38055.1 glyoxalase [Neobacillus notoginsengisoli]